MVVLKVRRSGKWIESSKKTIRLRAEIASRNTNPSSNGGAKKCTIARVRCNQLARKMLAFCINKTLRGKRFRRKGNHPFSRRHFTLPAVYLPHLPPSWETILGFKILTQTSNVFKEFDVIFSFLKIRKKKKKRRIKRVLEEYAGFHKLIEEIVNAKYRRKKMMNVRIIDISRNIV